MSRHHALPSLHTWNPFVASYEERGFVHAASPPPPHRRVQLSGRKAVVLLTDLQLNLQCFPWTIAVTWRDDEEPNHDFLNLGMPGTWSPKLMTTSPPEKTLTGELLVIKFKVLRENRILNTSQLLSPSVWQLRDLSREIGGDLNKCMFPLTLVSIKQHDVPVFNIC